MSLNNIKKMQSERGFTIVELLIVIVVIGILAAIVIVAYTGVTKKANASAAKGNAESILKVVEGYNADKGAYAAWSVISADTTLTAKPPQNVTVDNSTLDGSTTNDKSGKHIYVQAKGTTGACVAYWDDSTGSLQKMFAGDATTLSAATSSGTCG